MFHTRILVAVMTVIALASCATTVTPPAQEPPLVDVPLPSPSESKVRLSLRGDENFSPTSLTAAQSLWFDRTWSAVDASRSSIVRKIQTDNAYHFGRDVYQYNHALLLALRSTGDLRFLDEVDVVTQALRAQLHDGWCGNVAGQLSLSARYGTVTSPDGYLNFRRHRGSGRDVCRDVSDLEEGLIHGHLALVMYAFNANRGSVSPAGIDYGERADFWFDYLRNHFEAKWRGRSDTAWPDMDFLDIKFCHTYSQMTLYFYFMGKRLQGDGDRDATAYLNEARSMLDAMFDQSSRPGTQAGGFVEVAGPTGDAVIYSFGAPGRGDVNSTHLAACPTTYARYMLSSVTTFYAESMTRWDDEIMTKLANGISGFIMDRGSILSTSDTLAAGVNGSSTVAGMPATTYRGRLTVGSYGDTLIPSFTVWDESGKIERLSLQAYDVIDDDPDRPRKVFIPSSMLFVESATRSGLGRTSAR